MFKDRNNSVRRSCDPDMVVYYLVEEHTLPNGSFSENVWSRRIASFDQIELFLDWNGYGCLEPLSRLLPPIFFEQLEN